MTSSSAMESAAANRIAGRRVGSQEPAWIIAEVGVNHDGRVDRALELIRAAARAGADAVKFQAFRADDIAAAGAPVSRYQRAVGVAASDQRELLRTLQLEFDDLRRLASAAREHGLVFLASPFDLPSLDDLLRIGVPALKLGSGELTNLPLLRAAAAAGVPILLSTGMANWAEITSARDTLVDAGAPAVALLHCVTAYPTPLADANVLAVRELVRRFGGVVGYSDHTEGVEASLAARALGASVLERHLTYDRAARGPDHAASLEPASFAEWVSSIRRLETALGNGQKLHTPLEEEGRQNARKSIVARIPIAAGTRLLPEHLVTRRAAGGIGAEAWDRVVGRRCARALAAGGILHEEDLA
ncbi:MAG: N-acetylneuraminate synthase family protein [Planctomycetota bacterium]